MVTFNVPQLFDDSPHDSIQDDGVRIMAYHQNQEIERVNTRLNHNLIVFVSSGYKEVLGKKQQITIGQGEGFFLRKGRYLLSEKFGKQEQYRSYLFFFSDEVAHRFSRDHSKLISQQDSNNINLSKFKATTGLTTFLNSLSIYFEDSSWADSPDIANLKLRELFLLLANSDNGHSFKGLLSQLSTNPAQQLGDVMNLHYKENLSLEQFAFLAGYSLSTFKRRFKEEFGTTPGKWIKQKRLEEGKFLLHSSRKNVSQICFDVGFENLSHFIQSFKEYFGVTPKQFQLEQSNTEFES
ncbi:AraC-type DNA-binding protein [Fodinibius salinus]|uniref:AraC-type DNA-binding protein n=1 Tax=Fodinibius salinus TaxID=860790 RepID=A0A5D3YHP4_9BACT|nr:AraC family transcriptional regulator [Fodinibius salinus]TYP93424.1 AraC-type DNA-binding protein [Fodinibius salinus]